MNDQNEKWKYLEVRPNHWKKQLSIKGHRIWASTIWFDGIANNMSAEELAEDRELPLEVVQEALRYCIENKDLIQSECDEERRHCEALGH